MKKRKYGFIVAVFLVTIPVFAIMEGGWSAFDTLVAPPATTKASSISLDINEGESTLQIANELQSRGLIRNAQVFGLMARMRGLDTKLQAGAYTLNSTMDMDQIISKLLNGQPDGKWLVVQDGNRLAQIAYHADAIGLPRFSEKDFLYYTQHPDKFPDKAKYPVLNGLSSMEGLMYPNSYVIPVTYNTVQTIDIMLDQFVKVVKDNNLVALARQHQLSEYEMITLASIVQREAGNAKQMPTIAGIYWNRYKNPSDETAGFLDADPTVEYAHDTDHPPADDKYWTPLGTYGSGSTVEQNNSYNTYTYTGLPPTPISSPNLTALQSAASPAKTDYYFFLNDPATGNLICAKTYAEQLQNQAKYMKQ